jgi:Ca-activated chloride channel family protein
MSFIIILNILSSLWGQFDEIRKVNRFKAEAEKAYLEKNYTLAINKYSVLIYNFHSSNERIRMNLANAYYQNKDTAEAVHHYKKLAISSDSFLRSVSNQQLGLISSIARQDKKALSYFKEALKADPGNEGARFNYELTLKKIKEKEAKTPDKALPKDKKDEGEMQDGGNSSEEEKKDHGDQGEKTESKKNNQQGDSEAEGKTSAGAEGKQEQGGKNNSSKNSGSGGEENLLNEELELDEKGNKEREVMISRRLKKINMTEEKARTILDAMKNAETQYLQQIKKTGSAEYGKGKPDW